MIIIYVSQLTLSVDPWKKRLSEKHNFVNIEDDIEY